MEKTQQFPQDSVIKFTHMLSRGLYAVVEITSRSERVYAAALKEDGEGFTELEYVLGTPSAGTSAAHIVGPDGAVYIVPEEQANAVFGLYTKACEIAYQKHLAEFRGTEGMRNALGGNTFGMDNLALMEKVGHDDLYGG